MRLLVLLHKDLRPTQNFLFHPLNFGYSQEILLAATPFENLHHLNARQRALCYSYNSYSVFSYYVKKKYGKERALLRTTSEINIFVKRRLVTSVLTSLHFGKCEKRIGKALLTLENKVINNNILQYYKIFNSRGEVLRMFGEDVWSLLSGSTKEFPLVR